MKISDNLWKFVKILQNLAQFVNRKKDKKSKQKDVAAQSSNVNQSPKDKRRRARRKSKFSLYICYVV